MRDLERIENAIRDTDQCQAATVLPVIHVRADECADAGGIDIRHFSQVQDERAGGYYRGPWSGSRRDSK